MRIRAYVLEMAAAEILQLVPAIRIAELKAADPDPLFRAYVVGHEGKSQGNVLGFGNLVKKWYKAAIQKLGDILRIGLPVFHGHNYDNSQEGRTVIGEVVGKAVREISGRLAVIAITYIRPEFRSIKMDIASIEADLDLTQDEAGEFQVDVVNVSAVALGNREWEEPGFPGATLLAQVQAFVKKAETPRTGSGLRLGYRLGESGSGGGLKLSSRK